MAIRVNTLIAPAVQLKFKPVTIKKHLMLDGSDTDFFGMHAEVPEWTILLNRPICK